MPLNNSKPEDPKIITVETWIGGFPHVSGIYKTKERADSYARWVDRYAPDDQPPSQVLKLTEQEFGARLTTELPKIEEALERRRAELGRA